MQCTNECICNINEKQNQNKHNDKHFEKLSDFCKVAGKTKMNTENIECFPKLAMENMFQCNEDLELLEQFPDAINQQSINNYNTTTNYNCLSTMRVRVDNLANSTQGSSQKSAGVPPVATISGIFRRSALSLDEELIPMLQQEEEPSNLYTYAPDGATSASESAQNDNIDSIWLKGEHDALEKLAYNIWQLTREDHIVIDRKLNEVIRTNAHTNQKTIYRLHDPTAMGMNSLSAHEIYVKRKIGRPRKRLIPTEQSEQPPKISKMSSAADATKQLKTTEAKAQATEPTIQEIAIVRTRSGRVVRNMKPITPTATNKIKPLTESTSTVSASGSIGANNFSETPEIVKLINEYVAQIRDDDYRPPSNTQTISTEIIATPTVANPSESTNSIITNNIDGSNISPTTKPARFVPPESICPTCNKVFLGRRLERHFVKFPEHMRRTQEPNMPQQAPLASTENMSLFNFLIAKLQRHAHLNEDQRADLFLNELNDFIEQLQVRSTRLIRNTSGSHFVNTRTARVLAIPEGQYALDMTAIESEPDSVTMLYETTTQTMPILPPRNLVDYTTALSMSIDDTLTDEAAQKLNLSAGGKLLPPSEESLLRTVDDFSHMQDAGNIAKLNVVELQLQPPVVGISNDNRGVVVGVNSDTIDIVDHSDGGGVAIDAACSVVATHINGNNSGSGNGSAGVSVNDSVPNVSNVNGASNEGVGGLLSQYVHVSDNAVEAMNMNIEESTDTNMIVDFFQFKKN